MELKDVANLINKTIKEGTNKKSGYDRVVEIMEEILGHKLYQETWIVEINNNGWITTDVVDADSAGEVSFLSDWWEGEDIEDIEVTGMIDLYEVFDILDLENIEKIKKH